MNSLRLSIGWIALWLIYIISNRYKSFDLFLFDNGYVKIDTYTYIKID